MYSSKQHKYIYSYVLYKPTVHTFGSVFHTHTLWYRHTHMTFPPPVIYSFDMRERGGSSPGIKGSWRGGDTINIFTNLFI